MHTTSRHVGVLLSSESLIFTIFFLTVVASPLGFLAQTIAKNCLQLYRDAASFDALVRLTYNQ